MEVLNLSLTDEFHFIGFPLSENLRILVFCLILISFCVILAANILIIIVVMININLYIPMYIFLCNLSLVEIEWTTVTIPKMLADLLSALSNISFAGCFTQFYFVIFSGAMENILLAMMGYDRYLAICHPLRYSSIMTNGFCYTMTSMAWIGSSIIPMLPTILVSRLYFCRERDIDHFFCDFAPLVKLSCSDTMVIVKAFFGQAWILILGCSSVLVISYIYIISAILKIQNNKGREKAFSTCTAHISTVGILYGTLFFVYVRPSAANTSSLDKILSLIYSLLIPLLNPIIYSLRNKNIKDGLNNLISRKQPFPSEQNESIKIED